MSTLLILTLVFVFKTFYVYYFRVQLGEAPLVKTASSVFQDLCYNYRDQLMAGIICAGWDRRHGGQVRYSGINSCCQDFNENNKFPLGIHNSAWRYVCSSTVCHWWIWFY